MITTTKWLEYIAECEKAGVHVSELRMKEEEFAELMAELSLPLSSVKELKFGGRVGTLWGIPVELVKKDPLLEAAQACYDKEHAS